jgi:ABC-type antimicrobial peptide transport system permease subunit
LAIAPIRSAVAALEPTLPIYQVAALSTLVDRSLASDRFTTWLLAAFAAAALLLASVGIYSVFSGDVSQRRQEIGIRLALGSTGSGVAWLLLRVTWRRTVMGVVLGAALAFALARGMRSLLFGIEPSDPLSFLAVTAAVLAVATIATLIPLRLALRLSPVTALRADN